MQEGIIKVMA
jgi:hypothetical protein